MMPSKSIVIAFWVAVCFINSSEGDLNIHDCENDRKVIEALQSLPNGIVPILVITEQNPMITQSQTKNFIEGNYQQLILVNNTNRQCRVTDNILNSDCDISARAYPSLFMMIEGKLLSQCKVTEFNNGNLQIIRKTAKKSNSIPVSSLTLFEQIRKRLETSNASLIPVTSGIHPGILSENPVGMLPRPNSPVKSTTRKRNLHEILRSAQLEQQTNTQLIRQETTYPTERPIPKELDLLAAMENQSGGSPVTPSQIQGLKRYTQEDPNKRFKLGEGSSRFTKSRSPPAK